MARPDPFTRSIFESGHRRRRKSRKRFLGPLVIANIVTGLAVLVLLFAWISERRQVAIKQLEIAANEAELKNYRDPETGPLAVARSDLGRQKERIRDLEQTISRLRRTIEDRPVNTGIADPDPDLALDEPAEEAPAPRPVKPRAADAKSARSKGKSKSAGARPKPSQTRVEDENAPAEDDATPAREEEPTPES